MTTKNLLGVALIAVVGCLGCPAGQSGPMIEGIRQGWMNSVTVRYCDSPTVDRYDTEGGGFGPATFVWYATCQDGTTYRCWGVPRGETHYISTPRGALTSSSTAMEGECSPTVAQSPPAETDGGNNAFQAGIERCLLMTESFVEGQRTNLTFQLNGDGAVIFVRMTPPPDWETTDCLREVTSEVRLRPFSGDAIQTERVVTVPARQ